MQTQYLTFCALILIAVSGCQNSTTDKQVAQPPAAAPQNAPYLVVSLVDEGDAFDRAGDALVERHKAERVRLKQDELEKLVAIARKIEPMYVAFVVKPETLDINLVNRILQFSTQVDDDPFVDFAYGFITGRDADAAVGLVQASDKRRWEKASIAQFGVGSTQMRRSMTQNTAWPLRSGQVPVLACMSRGDTDETRDEAFIEKTMPKLDASPIVLLASHGYPNGLVGGPKASDLRGRDFNGSVAPNVACYTGVTGTWFDDDWQTGKVSRKTVSPDDSFCLQMIDNGVGAYVAYVCPRPAGPSMLGDALLVASSGKSIGEYWRQNSNSTVLAHLHRGFDKLEINEIQDGAKLKSGRTPEEVVLPMSTGGIVIGDPAFCPFAVKPDSDPRTSTVRQEGSKLIVDVEVTTPTLHFYAGEPINYWNGRGPAWRLETTVDIGDDHMQAVKLTKLNAGDIEGKLVAAVEVNRGKRLLHIKSTFAQPPMQQIQTLTKKGLSGQFEIETTSNELPNQPAVFRNEDAPGG